MIFTEIFPSLHDDGQWCWQVGDHEAGWYADGYAADEWLAKAYARVAVKRHEKGKDTP